MNTHRSPSQTDDLADGMWLESRGDLESYLSMHGVLDPDETTREDMLEPDAEIRPADEAALDRGLLEGKWVFDRPSREIDELWTELTRLVSEADLYRVKVSTVFANRMDGSETHDVHVYTPNYVDHDDVFRAREVLREACDVEEMIYYHPEIYDADGSLAAGDGAGSYRYSG